jgi:hypothetical protein
MPGNYYTKEEKSGQQNESNIPKDQKSEYAINAPHEG